MDAKVSILCDSPRGKIHALREASPKKLSPIIQLMPTGFRDIQPIQRNKCKQTTREHFEIDGDPNASNVIFPVILNGTNEDSHEVSDEKDEVTLKNPPLIYPKSPKPPPRRAISILRSCKTPMKKGKRNNKYDYLFDKLPENPPSFVREAYHKKKQAKFNEMRAMREKLAKLEKELQEAREQNKDLTRVASKVVALITNNTEEEIQVNSHDTSSEDKIKMEHQLAQPKEVIASLIAPLASTEQQSESMVNTLQAQLLLEQQANVGLSEQIATSNAALNSTMQRLLTLEKQLEIEKTTKEAALEQLKTQNSQHDAVSDYRLKEIESTIQNVDNKAAAHTVESLQSHVREAEVSSHMAEHQIHQLKKEIEYYQYILEKTIKGLALGHTQNSETSGKQSSILSIVNNEKCTCLYEGTRVINGKALHVQMYYEQAINKSLGVKFHFIVNEASTAQEDYLTFDVADLRRIFPDFEKYLLMCDKSTKNPSETNRLMEFAEKLFGFLLVGYKNGHLVLIEHPHDRSAAEKVVANLKSQQRMVVYHGNVNILDGTLVEICISEVWNASMSDAWWLEMDVVALETKQEFHVKLDQSQIHKVCKHIGSYRPTEGIMTELAQEAIAVHEELFEPLFKDLVIEQGQLLLRSCVAPQIEHQEQKNRSLEHIESFVSEKYPRLEEEEIALVVEEVEENEMSLDHRCVLLLKRSKEGGSELEDRYFCVRMIEKWDGILMLHITLDDTEEPEKYNYELIIKEQELIQIAELLSLTSPSLFMNPIDINEIPIGLPHNFRKPLCVFIHQTLRIIDTETKESHVILDWSAYRLPTHLSSRMGSSSSSLMGLPSQIKMIDTVLWEDVERIYQNTSEKTYRSKFYGRRMKTQYVCIKYFEIWTKEKERIVVIHAIQIGRNTEDQYRTLIVKAQVLAVEIIVKCWLG
jgi:hypothetical protein